MSFFGHPVKNRNGFYTVPDFFVCCVGLVSCVSICSQAIVCLDDGKVCNSYCTVFVKVYALTKKCVVIVFGSEASEDSDEVVHINLYYSYFAESIDNTDKMIYNLGKRM